MCIFPELFFYERIIRSSMSIYKKRQINFENVMMITVTGIHYLEGGLYSGKMLEVSNLLPRNGYQDDVEFIHWYS